MAKLFCVSDTHSHYTPLKKALDEVGFDPTNESHYLISLGDAFDRGPESKEVLKFLMSLERKVLVKGNHDILLDECCLRGFPYYHDEHNGTTRTIQDISGKQSAYDFTDACEITYNKLAKYRELLVNYFETKNYIFVHSWIPTITHYDKGASKPWHQAGKTYSYKEDWRNANEVEWEEAMWGNPYDMAKQNLNKTGKTIVFGHFHTSYQWAKDGKCSEFGKDAIWEPYINKEQGIIGIDRCTAHTGEVNVVVLEDTLLDG